MWVEGTAGGQEGTERACIHRAAEEVALGKLTMALTEEVCLAGGLDSLSHHLQTQDMRDVVVPIRVRDIKIQQQLLTALRAALSETYIAPSITEHADFDKAEAWATSISRWETTVQSPWPAPPPSLVLAPAGPARHGSGVTALAAILTLPLRLAWFLFRPIVGMLAGLLSVAAFLVLVAVLVAHALR